MFSFHKGETLPRSRQSSVDSQGLSSHTPGPAHEYGYSTDHDDPHVEMHAPSYHAVLAARRSSVFKMRSRSNTATSTTPSLLSLSHPDMAEHEGRWHGPPRVAQTNGQTYGEASKSGARRSFFRGRKGKRQSETAVPAMPDFAEIDLSERRASLLRKDRRRADGPNESVISLKHHISKPFDFQHLSHADRNQVAALEKVPSESLNLDALVASASRPQSRGFNGHFAAATEEAMNLDLQSMPSLQAIGQQESRHPEWHLPESNSQSTTGRPKLRTARSVESFSQPSVNPRKRNESVDHVLPPDSCAWQPPAMLESDSWHHEEIPAARRSSKSKRESGIWDSFVLPAVANSDQQSDSQEDSYFGHALTTPDDSAIHAITPPFSPSLADVAEEPDRFVSPRCAPQPPGRSPTTPRSPYFESFSFANYRSPPTRSRSHSQSQTSPHCHSPRGSTTRPSSQMSETLGSSNVTWRNMVRQHVSNRSYSNTWRTMEASWEEDVDYIYEHALEADCDNAWDHAFDNGFYHDHQANSRFSDQEKQSPMKPGNTREEPVNSEIFSGTFRTSLLVPSTSSLPDLAPASAISASTISTGLPTPCDSFGPNRFAADEGFVLTPSLLVPQEYKDLREATYEDLLDEYNASDRHFPMLDASHSVNSSTRSSRVRFSRRSSYDSSMMSVQGSGAWASQIRRSASSAGSVPELVPCQRTRKDQGLSLVIDKLSEQVSALESFEQNATDNDVTPPGRAFASQTFFAAGEETHEMRMTETSLVSELKESLQLARCGSHHETATGSENEYQGPERTDRSPMRQHKLTMSESATKLLSSSSVAVKHSGKARARAATTTQTQQPMLSLFPSPPR